MANVFSLAQFLGAPLLLIFDLKRNDKSLDKLYKHIMCNSFYTQIEAFSTHLRTCPYCWEAAIAQKAMISLKWQGEVFSWDCSLTYGLYSPFPAER